MERSYSLGTSIENYSRQLLQHKKYALAQHFSPSRWIANKLLYLYSWDNTEHVHKKIIIFKQMLCVLNDLIEFYLTCSMTLHMLIDIPFWILCLYDSTSQIVIYEFASLERPLIIFNNAKRQFLLLMEIISYFTIVSIDVLCCYA